MSYLDDSSYIEGINNNNNNSNNNGNGSSYIDENTSGSSVYKYRSTTVNKSTTTSTTTTTTSNIKISNISMDSINSNLSSNSDQIRAASENIWYFLKHESYQSISHISEFQSYQQKQENKSICSYIIDPSTTASSSYSKIYSSFGGGDDQPSIYSDNAYLRGNGGGNSGSIYQQQQQQSLYGGGGMQPYNGGDLSSNSGSLYKMNNNTSYLQQGGGGVGVYSSSLSTSAASSSSLYPMKDSFFKNDNDLSTSVSSTTSATSFNQKQQKPTTVEDNSVNNLLSYMSLTASTGSNNGGNSGTLKSSTTSSNGSSSSSSNNYIEQYLPNNNNNNNNNSSSTKGMDSSYHYLFSNGNNNSYSSSDSSTLLAPNSPTSSSTSTSIPSSPNFNITTTSSSSLSNSNSSSTSNLTNSFTDSNFGDNNSGNSNDIEELVKQQQQHEDQVLPWNESFQQLLDKPIKSLEDENLRNQNITLFSQLLANQAIKYVKTLVKEVHLPPNQKSIKPYDFGGYAGGEKYKIDSMFIKFALNPYNIYECNNPTSYFSSKSAGHELKSIEKMVSCGVPNLHFPLICLLNYRGFRLSVISELPISSNTIVFGSSNAGQTIHHDQTVYQMMVKIGEVLNLKNHLAKENNNNSNSSNNDLFSSSSSSSNNSSSGSPKLFKIPLAIDIEGHHGKDGRYYIVDSARLSAPEKPQHGITGGFLYRLFRFEFLKKYENQLCADSFSNFQVLELSKHNEEIEKATLFLINNVIPAFVENVLLKESTSLKKLNLKELLHKDGINLRYLGLILYIISTMKIVLSRYEILKGLITVEMLSRLLRFIVFSEMRKLNEPDDDHHLQIVVTHLNLLLSLTPSVNSHVYWSSFICNSLIAKFTSSIQGLEQQENGLKSLITESQGLYGLLNIQPKLRYKFLKKFSALTGIVINPRYLQQLKLISSQKSLPHSVVSNLILPPLTIQDLIEIKVIVKHMKILSSFKTFEKFQDAEQYYLQELEHKSSKLGQDHTQVAMTHIYLSDLYVSHSYLAHSENHLLKAIQIYENRFGQNDLGTATTKEKLGLVYIKQKKYQEATTLFKQVLEVKKSILSIDNLEIADTYDNLAWVYQNKGDFQSSIQYYSEALRIKNIKTGNSLTTAKTLNNIGHLFLTSDEVKKSIEIFCKVREIFTAHRGSEHSDVAIAEDNLGIVYSKTREYLLAEKSFKSAISIRIKQFGKDSLLVASSQNHLAQLYLCWGEISKTKLQESIALFKSAIRIADIHPDFYTRSFMRYSFSKYYRTKKDKTEEIKLINEALSILEMHNIVSDLTPVLRKRRENLSKTGLGKFLGWINNPIKSSSSSSSLSSSSLSSLSSPLSNPVPLINHNAIESSQSANVGGHMEMSSNAFANKNNSIPKEWQDIFSEIGITSEEMSDPKYSANLQAIIQEAFNEQQQKLQQQQQHQKTRSRKNSSIVSQVANAEKKFVDFEKKMEKNSKQVKSKLKKEINTVNSNIKETTNKIQSNMNRMLSTSSTSSTSSSSTSSSGYDNVNNTNINTVGSSSASVDKKVFTAKLKPTTSSASPRTPSIELLSAPITRSAPPPPPPSSTIQQTAPPPPPGASLHISSLMMGGPPLPSAPPPQRQLPLPPLPLKPIQLQHQQPPLPPLPPTPQPSQGVNLYPKGGVPAPAPITTPTPTPTPTPLKFGLFKSKTTTTTPVSSPMRSSSIESKHKQVQAPGGSGSGSGSAIQKSLEERRSISSSAPSTPSSNNYPPVTGSSLYSSASALSTPPSSSTSSSLYPKLSMDYDSFASEIPAKKSAPSYLSYQQQPQPQPQPPQLQPQQSSAPPQTTTTTTTTTTTSTSNNLASRIRNVVNLSKTGDILHSPIVYQSPPTSIYPSVYPNLYNQPEQSQSQQQQPQQQIQQQDPISRRSSYKEITPTPPSPSELVLPSSSLYFLDQSKCDSLEYLRVEKEIVKEEEQCDKKESEDQYTAEVEEETETEDQDDSDQEYEVEEEGQDQDEEESESNDDDGELEDDEEEEDDDHEDVKKFSWPTLNEMLKKEDFVNTIKQKLKEKREGLISM